MSEEHKMNPDDRPEEHPPDLPLPLLEIPALGEPTDASAQRELPITDGTLPAPDLDDGRRTETGSPRDDADRVRGTIVSETIAQHADHVIGARLGPLLERAVRVRTLDDDLIRADIAADKISGAAPPDPPPTTRLGRMSARMAAGGGLLALFFAVGIAEALFAYDGFRELARFRATDPALLREGAPALSAIVIALLIAIGQKAAGKNLRLAHTREPQPNSDGRRPLFDRDLPSGARYAVSLAIIVTGLALWYGVQSARTTANNAAAARQQAHQAAGARGAAAQRLAQNTELSASAPGVYFLVSSAVFLLGIGVGYLLVEPLREARERQRRRDADTLAHRDSVRSELAGEVGALVAQRAEIATTVANAKRQMEQEGVLHPEVAFLQRADQFPHLYGTWSPRLQAPTNRMPAVGEAHHAQAELAGDGGLAVPDKLADVDALIAELLNRNVASPKSQPG
ncbi:MAG: hypothetical protein QOD83_4015 [Solirubrobacteraceae bacterium]|jgi:hypothetical protein|nr:hypothetical protein [Solirubrobacteraceae bacterium]